MGVSLRTKVGYGMGHVLNDLCSAMWFSYLLLYFHHVLGFPNALAGVILLIGQVADALATPFVGHEVDRTDDLQFCVRYGRRKTWHLVGSGCVILTFAFIFLGCIGCAVSEFTTQVLYFAPFVILFQFGWAATQISHLAILPHLSADPHDRTELNAIRYAFTVISTITVYCVTWLILGLNASNSKDVLGPDSQPEFVKIVLIILGVGAIFTIGYHLMVKEKNIDCQSYPVISAIEDEDNVHSPMRWKDWFSEPQFYLIGLMYMFTRLFCNLTQAYMPLYLEDTLDLDAESIAYIPLVMYVSGLVTTLTMKPVNKLAGRKVTYILGCLLGLSGTLWIYFGKDLIFREYFLYAVAVLLGSASSTMLVTSLSITADFIGNNVESGGFVYGMFSFTDKLSNGVVVMLIQSLTPCLICAEEGISYFRYVLTFASGGSALLGIFSILLLLPAKIGKRSRRKIGNCSVESSSTADTDSSNGYKPIQNEDDNISLENNSIIT